jgi:hypothetical protein
VEGALTLNQLLAFTVVAEAIAEAGLTLACIRTVTVTATAIILGLETPANRTVIIQMEIRTIDVV